MVSAKPQLCFNLRHKAAAAIVTALAISFGQTRPASANEPLPPARYAFRSYGVDHGLTNLAPIAIAQDGQGFLWVGTEDGLFRYDGQRFIRYAEKAGLPSSFVEHLTSGADGTLWVGTQRGVAHVVENRLVAIGAEQGLPSTTVDGLAFDAKGCLWAAFSDGLFKSCDLEKFAIVPGWPGGGCTAISARGHSGVFAASGSELRFLDPAGKWTSWSIAADVGEERIDDVLEDPSGRLWVRSSNHIWMRPPGETRLQRKDEGVGPAYWRGHLYLGPDNEPWAATMRGIARWNSKRGAWDVLDTANGLPSALTMTVFADREGSVWIGGAGLHRWLGGGRIAMYTRREGLPSDVIWTILRDRDSRLWVGTDHGFTVATPNGWDTVPETLGHEIIAAQQALDGTFWLGSSPVKVFRFDPKTKTVDHFTDGLRGKRITNMKIDRGGDVWVATDRGGLQHAVVAAETPGSYRFEAVTLPNGSPVETFRNIVEDRRGRVWAAGEHGLAVRENGEWRRFTKKDGLADDYVAYLDEASDGTMRVVYWEPLGISRVSLENGLLRVIETIKTAKVYCLGEDPIRHRLWLGTGQGLDIVIGSTTDPSGIRHFGQTDGLPGDDFDATAFLAEANGDVWMGTSTGLALIHAANDVGWPEPPQTVILQARLGTENLSAGASAAPYDSAFEARYAGLSFLNEAQVNYETQLTGLEAAWRPTSVSEARFTNLHAGHYTFRVRARLASGPWGPESQVSFEVARAWWQTPWFILGMSLFGVSLAAAFAGWRVKVLRLRNLELKAVVDERTRELSISNAQLSESLQKVTEAQNRLHAELSDAAAHIRSMLPSPLSGRIRTTWRFIPSTELGGDGLGHFFLDEHRLVVYVIDVCGHGIPSSLLAISVLNALAARTLPGVDFGNPAEVLYALNETFKSTLHNGLDFTIWYGVIDTRTREIHYANGGHPPAVLAPRNGSEVSELDADGCMVGAIPAMEFETQKRFVEGPFRLYVFTDGLFEILDANRRLLDYQRFLEELTRDRNDVPQPDYMIDFARRTSGREALPDDVSLLIIDMD